MIIITVVNEVVIILPKNITIFLLLIYLDYSFETKITLSVDNTGYSSNGLLYSFMHLTCMLKPRIWPLVQ